MNRRRFLALSACALAGPAAGRSAVEWQGRGLGAALSLRLVDADPEAARRTFRRVEAEIARIEAGFSLHRDSALTRLNRDGRLARPSPEMRDVFRLAGRVHAATAGLFDPTIQPLWRATAAGGDRAAARALVGWGRVRLGPDDIAIGPGQALTFNGIAQGWAADRIAALLRAEGYGDALVDMGEVQALGRRGDGGQWRAVIAAPDGRRLAGAALSNRALATSAPGGTLIGKGEPHILSPDGRAPLWSVVSVSAPEAALADALSTACCLMERDAIAAALAAFPGTRLEYLG